jgi:uncharacterized protein (TIGR00369 family)
VADWSGDSVGWGAFGLLVAEGKVKNTGLKTRHYKAAKSYREELRGTMTKKKISKKEKDVVAAVRERMQRGGAIQLLGFDVERVEVGRAEFILDILPKHKQLHGVVHGGILASLADTTAAIAAYSAVPNGTAIATVEMKINFLEPVQDGRIRAVARVLRAGRNFVVTECEILTGDGKLAAKALLTFGAAAKNSLEG